MYVWSFGQNYGVPSFSTLDLTVSGITIPRLKLFRQCKHVLFDESKKIKFTLL